MSTAEGLVNELCALCAKYRAWALVERLRCKARFLQLSGRDPAAAFFKEELDLRLLDDLRGDTLLGRAVRAGDGAAVARLLELGADVDKANLEGESPVQVAHKEQKLDLVIALVRAGADYAPVIVDLTLLPILYKHCPDREVFLGLIRHTSEYRVYERTLASEAEFTIKSPTYEGVRLSFVRPRIRQQASEFGRSVRRRAEGPVPAIALPAAAMPAATRPVPPPAHPVIRAVTVTIASRSDAQPGKG